MMNMLNLHNNPMKKISLLSPFTGEKTEATEVKQLAQIYEATK